MYADLSREELTAIKVDLEEELAGYRLRNLKLNMARGKPASEQLDLSTDMMTIFKCAADCFSENGVDCRNYGELEGIDEAGEIRPEAKQAVEHLLSQSFRPEFLNRLDAIVFYKPLARDQIRKIIDLMLGDLNRRLKDQQLSLRVTDEAKDLIIEQAYDPVYGARPLRRYLQRHVETLLARRIIEGNVHTGQELVVDSDGAQLYLR